LANSACDSQSASAGDPPAPAPPATSGNAAEPGERIVGSVTATLDASNYTYVEVDTGGERIWAAGPQTPVEVGETVSLSGAMLMQDFHSQSLGRSFERIYFVASIQSASQQNGGGAGGSAHPGSALPGRTAEGQPPLDVTGIVRAEKGQTIAEIFQGRAELAGREVAVRGVVVKVNARIMGRNWLHLEDGTAGPGGETKLIVTSKQTAEVGNTVLVRGVLATDRDLGHGYHYDALVEEASITVE
jgi:hypothetical protein